MPSEKYNYAIRTDKKSTHMQSDKISKVHLCNQKQYELYTYAMRNDQKNTFIKSEKYTCYQRSTPM